jgi:hypothetical protein
LAVVAVGVVGLGIPATARASGVPIAPSSGLPGAPPVTPPTTSPARPLGTVDAATPVRRFGASLPPSSPIINNPDPVVCAVGCWEYTFAVPRGSTTPLLVAMKSTKTGPGGAFNADQGFDLYVYGPDGKLAAGANGVGANGQSVEVTRPARGTYTVVVTYAYAYDAGSGFTGEVRLMGGPSWTPPRATCGIAVSGVTGCFDLPALQALPAYDFTSSGILPVPSTPLGFPLPANLPLSTSCYADETVGLDNLQATHPNNPALRCLRFTTNIRNVGAGPLTAQIPAAGEGSSGQAQIGYVPGQCDAYQLVSRPDGSAVSRPAGPCEFHVEHSHFHYDNLLSYALYQAGPGTTLGHPVGVSRKASFCLADDDYFGFGSASVNGPRVNVGQPDCNLPREANVPQAGKPGTGTFVTEGITPGWGDVYTWDTPDQYINVTGVPSGTYDVVEETNPNGAILVAGPAQTCSLTKVHLTVGPSSDSVQVLGSAGSIPCPAH